ncbi:MAG: hypothetical protein ACYC61_15870 [Isosphaeraceae bacterium]
MDTDTLGVLVVLCHFGAPILLAICMPLLSLARQPRRQRTYHVPSNLSRRLSRLRH